MAHTQMTINEALDRGIFYVEYCGFCHKEGVRLYYLVSGMYAGSRFCRSCAKKVLKAGDHL